MDPVSERKIPRDFISPNSFVRVLVTTIAFGMGVSVKDVREVFHWGPPSSLLGYWQEVGRCARDGLPGRATMFLPSRSIDRRIVDEAMINLIRDKTMCIRRATMTALMVGGLTSQEVNACSGGMRCCNRCSCL